MSVALTTITPVAIDSPDRLENIHTVVDFLCRQLGVQEAIVVEHDETPKLLHAFDQYPNVRYLFVKAFPQEVWNKPKVVNAALPWVRTPVCAVWDADVIVPHSQIHSAVEAITTDKGDAAVPYDAFTYVERKLVRAVREGQLPLNDITENGKYVLGRFASIGAGCVLYKTSVLKHIRGLNELFYGWGLEDDEVIYRLTRLEFRVLKANGLLLHFAHRRTHRSKPLNDDFQKLLKAECQRIGASPPEVLGAYFGITPKIGRYNSLRAPDEPNEELKKLLERQEQEATPLDYPEPEEPL